MDTVNALKIPKRTPPYSTLLSLPAELRSSIWEMVLKTTILDFECSQKHHLCAHSHWLKQESQQHQLALLEVSKQVNAEVKDLWLKLVLFDFTRTCLATALNKLSRLPSSQRSLIRRLRLRDKYLHKQDLTVLGPHYGYTVGSSLRLLDNLCLGILTIYSAYGNPLSPIYTLTNLIRWSYGWHELHFYVNWCFPHSVDQHLQIFSQPLQLHLYKRKNSHPEIELSLYILKQRLPSNDKMAGSQWQKIAITQRQQNSFEDDKALYSFDYDHQNLVQDSQPILVVAKKTLSSDIAK